MSLPRILQWSRAALAVACVLVGPGSRLEAQPAPRAAQEQFVPVREVDPADRLPAAPLLIAAYAFIWVAAFGYLWWIWRRLATVEREIDQLRRAIGDQGSGIRDRGSGIRDR